MTPEQFTYWLQGFVEVTDNSASASNHPTDEQWRIIKDHLQTVFHKVTPDYTPAPYYSPTGTGKKPWEPPYETIC